MLCRIQRCLLLMLGLSWSFTQDQCTTPRILADRKIIQRRRRFHLFATSSSRREDNTRALSLERQSVKLKPETLSVGDPQLKSKREIGIEDMLRELREIQGQGPRGYCILGTRHCSYLHQQIIELLSYALVLSENHVYTSGASGTNAAAIRGALRAENPDLLTVVLPQSLDKQPDEARELVQKVKNVVEMPQNDFLPLEVASRICNRRLISLADQLVAFAFHSSHTVVEAANEAEDMDKIVTIMYLD